MLLNLWKILIFYVILFLEDTPTGRVPRASFEDSGFAGFTGVFSFYL